MNPREFQLHTYLCGSSEPEWTTCVYYDTPKDALLYAIDMIDHDDRITKIVVCKFDEQIAVINGFAPTASYKREDGTLGGWVPRYEPGTADRAKAGFTSQYVISGNK